MFSNRKPERQSPHQGIGTRLKSDEGYFLFTPKNVINGLGVACVVGCFAWGFADAAGFSVSSEKAVAEDSEVDIRVEKIIPEPIQEFVTTLSTADGSYGVTGYINFKFGRIDEDIWVPGTDRNTDFINDPPIRVITKGEDMDTLEFIDGKLDLISGKPTITAVVHTNKLRFDAELLDGVQLDPSKPRPLIVDNDPAKTKVFDDMALGSLNRAILACQALPFGDDACEKIDFLNLNGAIEKLKAINNSDARIAALEATKKCHAPIWESHIKPALELAAIKNVLKYRPMTEEEAKRLITIQFVGGVPDFTKSKIDDYVKDGTLAASATGKFSIKKQDNLNIICSVADSALTDNTAPVESQAPLPSSTPGTGIITANTSTVLPSETIAELNTNNIPESQG